jgi:hypothetical protein
MENRLTSVAIAIALASAAALQPVRAETLLMERVQKESGVSVPNRGMSMSQVEGRFGAPLNKLEPRGGDAPRHPVINRWVYDRFTVYFERDRVIDTVLNKATPNEIGPKGTASTQ